MCIFVHAWASNFVTSCRNALHRYVPVMESFPVPTTCTDHGSYASSECGGNCNRWGRKSLLSAAETDAEKTYVLLQGRCAYSVCVWCETHNSHAQFARKFSSGECASVTAVLYSLTQVSCPSILVPDNDTLRSLLEEEHGSLTDPNTMLPPTDIVELLNSTYRIQEDVRLCTILL